MIVIALGSSLPFCGFDSQQIVEKATFLLGKLFLLKSSSPCFQSPAWPDLSDPPYVNAVAIIETSLSPHEILATLQAIEAGFGRRRIRKNGPRTLDLDIIDVNGAVLNSVDLALPHPRCQDRDFVLAPLAEIAPTWRHPTLQRTAGDLLLDLDERSAEKIT